MSRFRRLSISSLSSSSTPTNSPRWGNARETDETRQLEMILADPPTRQGIIAELLALHTDDSLKVRFITLYNEYRLGGFDPAKGKKLVRTFFRPGMFQLRSYPEEDLACVRVSDLGTVKTCMLLELTKIPLIEKYLKDE